MTSDFSYYDLRFGDTYAVELDAEGTFTRCLRYLGPVGVDPIVYDTLEEIPPQQRSEIEQRIAKRKRK